MKDESSAALSRREKEVVGLLLQGKSNKQIALSLGVSERTVEFHLRNIYNKTQVSSRVELILKLGKRQPIFLRTQWNPQLRQAMQIHIMTANPSQVGDGYIP